MSSLETKAPNLTVTMLYSGFLDEAITAYSTSPSLIEQSKYFKKINFTNLLTKEAVLEKRLVFLAEWEKYSNAILSEMYNLTGLAFQRNIIDIYIVRAVPRTFSNPIIIFAGMSVDRFLQTLTHELVHILIRENLGISGLQKLDSILEELFPQETKLTRDHVLLYAILHEIYAKVFPNTDRFEKEIEWSKNYSTNEYTVAIELGSHYGYKKIIEDVIKEMSS